MVFRLLSENKESYSYIVSVEGKKYELLISKSGEIISMEKKNTSSELSSCNKIIEFG